MIHNLSKIFMDYGDSNWTIGILIGLFVVTAGIILWVMGEVKEFPDQGSLSVFGIITVIVGVLFGLFSEIGCAYDEESQVLTAIRNEYKNASFSKQNKTFTSNGVTYSYEIKDRKITVRPLDNANVKIIE